MTALLKENRLWSYVNTVIHVPQNDPVALDAYEVKEAKAQRFLLDGVKHALIPHLSKKKTADEMWGVLKKLYETKNENRKMALKEKLHGLKMLKEASVTSYLTRVTQLRDELAAVGEVVAESEVVRISLRGVFVINKDWEVFEKCIVARENLPRWNRLWDDLTQEELKVGGQIVENSGQKDLALAGKSKRRKASSRNLGKVRCFGCGQFGHLIS